MKLFLLLIAGSLLAQIVPVTIADVTGDGAAHAISTTTNTARTVSLSALTANTAGCRVGDSAITSTRGTPVPAGATAYFPESSGTGRYALNSIYYLCQAGDKLSISWTQ